jgi:hypothetical protein
MPIRWGKAWLFFALAFGGTYALVAIYLWGFGLTFADPAWLKLSIVGMLAPALSALALQLIQDPLAADRLEATLRAVD